MKRLTKIMITITFIITLTVLCQARENPDNTKSSIKQVALFKNGLGFFQSNVVCPDKVDSFSFIPDVAASHGTLWVSYTEKIKLKNLVSRYTDIEKTRNATSIAEILKANVGRNVKLVIGDEQITGTIKFFAEYPQQPVPEPYSSGLPNTANQDYRGGWYPQPAQLMTIETEQGEICVNPNSVSRVEFPGGKSENQITEESKVMQLDIHLDKPAKGQPITVSYLAKGITWAPSYIIDITEPEKAGLAAKAVVINEAADLDDITIQLVTGYPNLQFADIASPLAMKENLAQFLQALISGESERGAGRYRHAEVMSQSVAYNVAFDYEVPSVMPSYGTAQSGTVAEDLFFYPLENITLGKNQTGYFPLFTELVPYEHIYKWDIADYINADDRYYYDRNQQDQQKPEEVWHCIRLENIMDLPWTTAPAEIVKSDLILGQDTLRYTPVKGKNDVRITQAVNVKAEQVENETARQRDALQIYGNHYDLITIEGNLSVTNYQDKTVKLEITKILSGEVKTSEPTAEFETLARGLKRMNSTRKLKWTLDLENGQTQQIKYTYDVYVRR
jgi:hypothetical protein